MIAFYRRLPHFISNNIRTFATSKTLHRNEPCLQLKRLKEGDWGDVSDSKPYRILEINENVRMLFISSCEKIQKGKSKEYYCNEQDNVWCTIRVGVGYEDDTHYPGISHLCEHVFVNEINSIMPTDYLGETFHEHTAYKFLQPNKAFWDTLKEFSQILFNSSSLDNLEDSVIECELKQIDGEFHIKRAISHNEKMQQIYKTKQIKMPNFGNGNIVTLPEDKSTLRTELKERHELYQERPVLVCICSTLPLDKIEENFKENFWLCNNNTDRRRKQRDLIDWNTEVSSYKHFFVVKSDADLLQLKMLFPFDETFGNGLDLKKSNTLESLATFLSRRIGNNLKDLLLKRKIGTDCSASVNKFGFQVSVDLFYYNAAIVREVANVVFAFCQHLSKNWRVVEHVYANRLNAFKRKNCYGYLEFIADKCYEINATFDEANFFNMLEDHQAQKLISDGILQNRNVVYSIVTRDPKMVLDDEELGDILEGITDKSKIKLESESYYGTQYYAISFDSLILNDGSELTSTDFGSIKTSIWIILIEDTKDLAIQSLFVAILETTNEGFRRDYKILFNGNDNQYKINYRLESLPAFFKKLNGHFTFPEINCGQFEFARAYKMRSLSAELVNSENLALSLLTVAILNIHCQAQIHPIPMQYDTLRGIDYYKFIDYINHQKNKLNSSKSDIKKINSMSSEETISDELIIKSINTKEKLTVTIYLFKVSTEGVEKLVESLKKIKNKARRDYGIYRIKCYSQIIGGTNSVVVIETYTVENKDCCSDDVREMILTKIEERIHDVESVESLQLQKMIQNKICIQVQGHVESKEPKEETFREQFDNWFNDKMKTEFHRFFRIPAM